MAVYYFRKKDVKFEVFHWTVEIVFTNNVTGYAKHRGWRPTRDEDTTGGITLFFAERLMSVIILPPTASPGTIAHESWHAIRTMLTDLGATLDSETVAYHLGYLVDSVHSWQKEKWTQKKVDKKKKR